METVTSYWGNSLGFRIPKSLQEISNITDKTRIRIEAEPNKLIITKVPETRTHKTLADRLKNSETKPYNVTEDDKIWLDMPNVGEEEKC
jgi:antitoxin component of MazEF toxin-antitoxin module